MLLDKLVEKYDIDPLKGEEIVHISQNKYDKMVAIAKKIHENTEDISNMNFKNQFTDEYRYPTVAQLINHNVEERFRDFLPYLIFYKTIKLEELMEDDGYIETLKYIKKLFKYHLDIIEDKDLLPLQIVPSALWRRMKKEEKKELLRPVVEYYGMNEFLSFIHDLEYMNFMQSYGFKEKDYKEKDYPEKMFVELKKLFDEIQGE